MQHMFQWHLTENNGNDLNTRDDVLNFRMPVNIPWRSFFHGMKPAAPHARPAAVGAQKGSAAITATASAGPSPSNTCLPATRLQNSQCREQRAASAAPGSSPRARPKEFPRAPSSASRMLGSQSCSSRAGGAAVSSRTQCSWLIPIVLIFHGKTLCYSCIGNMFCLNFRKPSEYLALGTPRHSSGNAHRPRA